MKTAKIPVITATVTSTIELPEGIVQNDLSCYDPMKAKDKYKPYAKLDHKAGNSGQLEFYYVTGRGWVITTLHISNGKGFADRSYGIDILTGGIVTVGKGPHVTKTINVYLRLSRLKALQKYIDLYNKGLISAGQIRDRISTRRANTVMRRSLSSGFGW